MSTERWEYKVGWNNASENHPEYKSEELYLNTENIGWELVTVRYSDSGWIAYYFKRKITEQ